MAVSLSVYSGWLPGQDSGQHFYTPVVNPRTGRALAVPALVLPKAA